MSAISLVEHSGDGFRNCLFLDAVVDVEELACSLECVRSIQPRGSLPCWMFSRDMLQLISVD